MFAVAVYVNVVPDVPEVGETDNQDAEVVAVHLFAYVNAIVLLDELANKLATLTPGRTTYTFLDIVLKAFVDENVIYPSTVGLMEVRLNVTALLVIAALGVPSPDPEPLVTEKVLAELVLVHFTFDFNCIVS